MIYVIIRDATDTKEEHTKQSEASKPTEDWFKWIIYIIVSPVFILIGVVLIYGILLVLQLIVNSW